MSAIAFSFFLLTVAAASPRGAPPPAPLTMLNGSAQFFNHFNDYFFPTDTLNLACVQECSLLTKASVCPWSASFAVDPAALTKAFDLINKCIAGGRICGVTAGDRNFPMWGLQDQVSSDLSYVCVPTGPLPAGAVKNLRKTKMRYSAFNSSAISISYGIDPRPSPLTIEAVIGCSFTQKGASAKQGKYYVVYTQGYKVNAVIGYTGTTPTVTVTSASKTNVDFKLPPAYRGGGNGKMLPARGASPSLNQAFVKSGLAMAAAANDTQAYAQYFATYAALALQALHDKWCPK